MERVRALINKLQEQLDEQADSQSLLATVQLLQAELQPTATTAVSRNSNSKVAVVMPSFNRQMDTTPYEPKTAESNQLTPQPQPESEHVQKEEKQVDWLHSLMQEIPTLAHQKDIRELNEVMGQQHNATSLNDKLKQHSLELSEVLTREPVRDLKKAIGVNDRFVFVNELFRGDETMYERSIKTINSFHILQEAEFWIERELKLKLAWDETKEPVMHFLQLVRRRFTSR